MCQKAFGNLFAALVHVEDITWTRGERAIFHSSDTNWRGFCKDCGTPLTYEFDGHIEIAVGALDNPDLATPTVQVNAQFQRRCFSELGALPVKPADQQAKDAEWNASVVSHQHPDHDT